MHNRHIKLSDSPVFRQFEKIAIEKGLIKVEPVIEKTASVVEKKVKQNLESTSDLTHDVVILASRLREKGFEKQAIELEKKLFVLKKAMTESNHNSLYDFWKETGEAFVDYAHKSNDGDFEGYKVKNNNEIRKTIINNINKTPTGYEKAAMMAKKVGYLLMKMGKDGKGTAAPSTAATAANSLVIRHRSNYEATYNKQKEGVNIDKLIENGYIDNNLQTLNKIPKFFISIEQISFLSPNDYNILLSSPKPSFQFDYFKGQTENTMNEWLNAQGASSKGLISLRDLGFENYITITLSEEWRFGSVWSQLMARFDKLEIGNKGVLSLDNAIEAKKAILGGDNWRPVKLNVSLNNNGKSLLNAFSKFTNSEELLNLVTTYVNTYLNQQSDFITKWNDEVVNLQNIKNRFLGTLNNLKKAIKNINPKDPDIEIIETLKTDINAKISIGEDESIIQYTTRITQAGYDEEQLKTNDAHYRSVVDKLNGTK